MWSLDLGLELPGLGLGYDKVPVSVSVSEVTISTTSLQKTNRSVEESTVSTRLLAASADKPQPKF